MMTTYRITSAAALLLALLSAPCQGAVAVAEPGAVRAPQGELAQGVLEAVSGSALRISGKDYVLSSIGTSIYNRGGTPVNASQLAVGKTIAFSVVQEGSQARIKELWIVK